jgi:hypothetical protein
VNAIMADIATASRPRVLTYFMMSSLMRRVRQRMREPGHTYSYQLLAY